MTKGEALADLLWKYALGFSTEDPKTGKTVVEKPKAWAIQLIYDRLEGKVPIQTEVGIVKPTASERISDLSRDRINNMAEKHK